MSKNADIQSQTNVSPSSPCVPWFASLSVCVVCGWSMRPCDVRGVLRVLLYAIAGTGEGYQRERERETAYSETFRAEIIDLERETGGSGARMLLGGACGAGRGHRRFA